MKTKLLDLIDFEKVDALLEGFNNATGFVTAILDLEGTVLSKSGWRKICTDFHRIHPETAKRCTISDTVLAGKLAKDEKYHIYKCLNGLVDVAVPLVIKGEHIANIFTGQFFFEEADKSFFQKQAKAFGFDENNYLNALLDVPIVSEEKAKKVMEFLLNMTILISNMAFQKIEQLELIEALQQSEQRWQFALEGNGDGVWDWNALTNKVLFSKRWKEMLGYQDDEIANDFSEWERRVHPDDIENCNLNLLKLLEGKTDTLYFEHRLKCKDGNYKWILSRGKVISRTEDNNAMRIIGTHIDLSSRKQAEEAIIHEKEFSEKIIDTSTAIIIGLDKDHIIQLFNKGAEIITGYSNAEVIGKDWFELFFSDDIFDEMNNVWKKAWGMPSHSYKNQILIKNGEQRIISFQSTGIYEGEDSSKHILISIGEDITDKILAENELRESQAFSQTLLNTSPDLIYIYDIIDNKNIYSNKGIMKILGYSIGEVQSMGENVLPNLMHPDDFNLYLNDIIPLYQSAKDEEIIEHNYRMKHRNGSWCWLNSKETIFMRQEDGSPKQIFGLTSDITSQKMAEIKLTKYQNQLEELVKERTLKLEKQNKTLEKINKAFVGRELRMIELKKEIEKLKGS